VRQFKSLDPEKNATKLATRKLDDVNLKGAIRTLCFDDTIASFDDQTFLELVEKHPKAVFTPNVQNFQKAAKDHYQTSPSDVLKKILSFPPGLAAGSDGLHPQIVKDLTSAQVVIYEKNLLKSITHLCNLMLERLVSPSYYLSYMVVPFVPSLKKDGGIRPNIRWEHFHMNHS